MSANPKLTFDY